MGALLPQSRTCAVQTEAAIQSDIGLIRTLGRVFLDHLRKCVQQGVAILFCKFRMPRVFELPINRNNIALLIAPSSAALTIRLRASSSLRR